jgi:hypothetical protein
VLHSEILPEQDCGGELIGLPEDEPTYVHFAQCVRCGTEFTFVPDSDWVTVSGEADLAVSDGSRRQSEPPKRTVTIVFHSPLTISPHRLPPARK